MNSILPNNLTNHTCLMLIGLPGVGKSTLIAEIHKTLSNAPVVSTDKYIEQYAQQKGLTYMQSYREFSDLAEKSMKVELASLIKNKETFIWDQTNLTVKSRGRKITYLKQHKYDVMAFYFDISDEVNQQRIDKRYKESGKFIPNKILQTMRDSYVFPSFKEGFTKIFQVKESSIVELSLDVNKGLQDFDKLTNKKS